jgi:hypothetical protein
MRGTSPKSSTPRYCCHNSTKNETELPEFSGHLLTLERRLRLLALRLYYSSTTSCILQLRLACTIIYERHYDLHVGPGAVHAQCLCHDISGNPTRGSLPPVEENKMVRVRAQRGEEFEPITGPPVVLQRLIRTLRAFNPSGCCYFVGRNCSVVAEAASRPAIYRRSVLEKAENGRWVRVKEP